MVTVFQVIGFQSTLSHGERLINFLAGLVYQDISIHALTRRATCDLGKEIEISIISIHALTRRATISVKN